MENAPTFIKDLRRDFNKKFTLGERKTLLIAVSVLKAQEPLVDEDVEDMTEEQTEWLIRYMTPYHSVEL